MRDCYKKFWKTVLVEKMRISLPQFALKEGAARKAADEAKPSSKPLNFFWNPIDKLTFTIGFFAPSRLDHFDAWFYWSEKGKIGANGTATLDFPFPENTNELVNASVMVQTLSGAINDNPRVFRWPFWEPTRSLGSSSESHRAWQDEYIAELSRVVSDEELRKQVEVAVDKAIVDIKRCALPWFKKKLEWYQKNRK